MSFMMKLEIFINIVLGMTATIAAIVFAVRGIRDWRHGYVVNGAITTSFSLMLLMVGMSGAVTCMVLIMQFLQQPCPVCEHIPELLDRICEECGTKLR